VSVAERLAALGLSLPALTAPLASYVPAVRAGQWVFSAGQLPFVDGVLPATGLVGEQVDPDLARELAARAGLNALAAVASVLDGGLDDVARVVKVVGYVAASPTFTAHPGVVNGASDLIVAVLGEGVGTHARSAVGVASLPLGSPVEVEVVAMVR